MSPLYAIIIVKTPMRLDNSLDDTVPSSVIPNLLERKDSSKRKNDNYSIGFVGMVPKRKRLDLAIDLLEYLQKIDPRYQLKIVGKHPDEYGLAPKKGR